MVKILNPKNDVVFQKLFGSEQNKVILISFLNSVLERSGNGKIKEVTIEEKRLDVSMIVDEKLSILDIHVTTDNNVHVNVEIQLINQYNMIKRTLFYWSKIYLKQLKKGDIYSELDKTITVNILDFDYININKFHSWYHLYENDTKYKLTDILEIHFIEMPKFNKSNKEYKDKLHRWLQFLQDPTGEEVKEIMLWDEEIKEAMGVLSEISGDEEVIMLAELREKAIRDEASRLSGARLEGENIGAIKNSQEFIIDNLNELGNISEEVMKLVDEEKDLNILKKWMKISSRVNSITEFLEKIKSL